MAWKAIESLNFTVATEYAQRALQVDPSLAEAHYIVALAQAWLYYMRPDQYDAETSLRLEIESLAKASALDPSRAEYHLALALAWRRANRFAEAAKAFEAHVSLEPTSMTGWYGLGESRLHLGQLKSATTAFATGLAREPGHRWFQRYHALANGPGQPDEASFAARLLALHGERVDCPQTAAVDRWMQLVAKQPDLGCVRALATETSLPDHEALRLIMLGFQAAVTVSRSAREHEVPQRAVLFGYQSWFGFDVRKLIKRAFDDGVLLVLIDGEPAVGAGRLTQVTEANLRSLSHGGISLWSVCVYRLMVHLRSLPSDFDLAAPRHLNAVQALYGAAIAAIDEANAFCDFYQPESIVITQGYDVVAAALRNVGLQRGIRVVAIENTFHRERLLWEDISGIAVNLNQAKNYFWRYRDSIPDELAARSVSEYLRSMGTLKSVEHTSPAGGMVAASPPQTRTITYIGQVGVDSSVLFGLRGFESQVELIAALATYAAENSCRLLIKLHPKESPHYPDPVPYYRRLTAGWLEQHAGFQENRRRLGASLVLDDENQFNTYELIRQADVCVTITSQAGLEALLMGKEVVLCGDAFYGGLGFTLEATDECSLRFQLGRVLNDGLRVNNPIQCAKFFHSFTELYCLHKSEDALFALMSGRPPLPSLSVLTP
jgi:tetratricopeptide (TPR) repeat protein